MIQTSNQNEFQLRSIKKGGHIRGRLRHGGVSLVLKADLRPGVTGALTGKVEAVERYLEA